jgi:rhodanese-related sulfurtransferase
MTRSVQAIKPADLDQLQHGPHAPQLIDCRTPGEFATGHVPGSLNIPVDEMAARRHDIDPARPVVFICASGRRAAMAAQLANDGADVSMLDGGVSAWQADGRALVGRRSNTWSLERQVRFAAGSIVALGSIASLVDIRLAIVPIAVGLGLTFTAVANSCALGALLMRMPWNRRQA